MRAEYLEDTGAVRADTHAATAFRCRRADQCALNLQAVTIQTALTGLFSRSCLPANPFPFLAEIASGSVDQLGVWQLTTRQVLLLHTRILTGPVNHTVQTNMLLHAALACAGGRKASRRRRYFCCQHSQRPGTAIAI